MFEKEEEEQLEEALKLSLEPFGNILSYHSNIFLLLLKLLIYQNYLSFLQ